MYISLHNNYLSINLSIYLGYPSVNGYQLNRRLFFELSLSLCVSTYLSIFILYIYIFIHISRVSQCSWLSTEQKIAVESCIKTLTDVAKSRYIYKVFLYLSIYTYLKVGVMPWPLKRRSSYLVQWFSMTKEIGRMF